MTEGMTLSADDADQAEFFAKEYIEDTFPENLGYTINKIKEIDNN